MTSPTLEGFPPLVGAGARTLILGNMPGVAKNLGIVNGSYAHAATIDIQLRCQRFSICFCPIN